MNTQHLRGAFGTPGGAAWAHEQRHYDRYSMPEVKKPLDPQERIADNTNSGKGSGNGES